MKDREEGVALVIVLAFVVILTGVIIAYFSRSLANRAISNSSASQTKVALFAQGATDDIIASLQQEIVDPAFSTPTGYQSVGNATVTGSFYLPASPAYMLPYMSGSSANGVTSWAPNFLARSAYAPPSSPVNGIFYSTNPGTNGGYNIPGNATNVPSTTPSLNGRSVSLARWNSHYMLPFTGGTDATPITTGTNAFAAPDWVLVSRNGSNPGANTTSLNPQSPVNLTWSSTGSTTVIGRYAYAIYNEGGMLDANVAGYPSTTSTAARSTSQPAQAVYKPVLSYADLTQLSFWPGGPTREGQEYVDQLVAWRNYASAQAPNPYNVSDPFGTTGNIGAASGSNSGNSYYKFVTTNPSGFLSVSSTNLNSGKGVLTTGTGAQGQSDRLFESRQELIAFMKNGLGLSGLNLNVLNYLGTFTRGLDQPSIAPDPSRPVILSSSNNGGNSAYLSDKLSSSVPDPINPSFLSVRVSGTGGWLRNDGSVAVGGEPLVKTRFALSRLAWITYLGPSANRVIPALGSPNPGLNNVNYDMWALVNLYGVSPAYLQQGTRANILKYFGLVWMVDTLVNTGGRNPLPSSFHDGEYKWFYTGHNNTSANHYPYVSGTAGPITRLADLATATGAGSREPDFFELLKASVTAGSIAKGAFNDTNIANDIGGQYTYHPYYYQNEIDTDLDYSIMQLGANIIDESKIDGYSTRIVFNDNSGSPLTPYEFRGVENLPYMYRFNSATLKLRMEGQTLSSATNDEEDTPPATYSDPGVGMIMEVPTIWNPHDATASLGYPGPSGAGVFSSLLSNSPATNFRMIADSTYPPAIIMNGTTNYTGFFGNGTENQESSSSTQDGVKVMPTAFTVGPKNTGGLITPGLLLTPPPQPNPLYPGNSTLFFNVPNSASYREPTILAMPNVPSGSQLQMGPPIPEFTLIQNQKGKVAYSGTGGFLSDGANPLNLPGTGASGGSAQTYLGFCFALYPIEWLGPNATSSGTAGVYQSANVGLDAYNGPSGGGPYVTFRLQYRDPNTNSAAYSGSDGSITTDSSSLPSPWETYDEKYTTIDTLFLGTPFGTTASGNLADQADGAQGGDWQSYADPRTSRFGGINGKDLTSPVQTPTGTGQPWEWINANSNEAATDRPDFNSGYGISDNRAVTAGNAAGGFTEFYNLKASGWTIGTSHFRIGLLSQNSSTDSDNGVRDAADNSSKYGTTAEGPMFYADPDGVVRNAMGAYNLGISAPANGVVGLPLATAYPSTYNFNVPATNGTYQGESRPYFLHRPLRSVAELGYVFSGTPWKDIDFFTPQSGDTALLDVFTPTEPPLQTGNSNPLVAGVVNLNTRQAPVLQAILSGAYVDEALASGTVATAFGPTTLLTGTQASVLATGLVERTGSSAAGTGPLENVGDLVGRWTQALSSGTNYATGYIGTGFAADLTNLYNAQLFVNSQASPAALKILQTVDRFREAAIRPLAAVGNTRVWNLMIDVIAQTGRYPQGTTNPAYFVVDGEQRYWVHVAIDRFTGQVLDKQIEVVRE